MSKLRKKNRIIALALVLTLLTPLQSSASKLTDAINAKKKTESELKSINSRISELKNAAKAVEDYMDELNEELEEIGDELTVLENKITKKEQEITIIQKDLNAARAKEESQYESMKKRIKYLYESNSMVFEVFVGSENMADMLNKAEYASQMSSYDREKFEEYKSIKETIQEKEEALQKEKSELEALEQQALDKQQELSDLLADSAEQLSEHEEDLKAAEKKAEEYEKKIRSQESQINQLTGAGSGGKSEGGVSKAASYGDIQIMAAIIQCEAGGESYTGKIAVGNVVMNRVRSGRFPNTILGVIYQKGQFSPVRSGRFAIVLARGANSSCTKAAKDVLNGKKVIGNQLFFRTVIPGINGKIIGHHIFY